MKDMLNDIIPAVYKREFEEMNNQIKNFLEQKIAEHNREFLAVMLIKHGYYTPYRYIKITENGFFQKMPIKNSYILDSAEDAALFSYLARINDEIRFIYQFVMYISLKCPNTITRAWLFSLFPKLVRDKLAPSLPYKEIAIDEADKAKYEQFKQLIQVNAVNSFLL